MKINEISSVEIAKLAGVSRSTVSRVINNYPNVPEKTKAKVMKVIEEHNYVPNISAQVLAGKKVRVLGLFLITDGLISSDILSSFIISSVIESANAAGFHVLTHMLKRNNRTDEDIKTIKELFYQKRIDGGIFIGAANYEPFIEELIGNGYVVGLVDHYLPGHEELNRVVINFDNEHAGEQVVDYLTELNHRSIGMIMGDMTRYGGPTKYNGFLNGMKKHGLEIKEQWMLPGDFTETSGYQAIDTLLARSQELPTALFAVNDSTAFGAIRALQAQGLDVPRDISIVGLDDHLLSSYFKPSVTTFRVDFYSMMGSLTNAVIHMIEEGSEHSIQMKMNYTLVERESCRAV